ncbi:MAG: type II secretion system protein [Sulfurimonas sp.]|nr:type II secretion system protein [Sulfurimonas sp.]
MIQGSNMIRGQKGMRSGITLVEMMLAVILFGLISVVGFKYSKNYYNTTLYAKKARVAALVEQGTQLSNAYDIYNVQFGIAPVDLDVLSSSNVKILTETPVPITEMLGDTNTWQYTVGADLSNGNNGVITGGPDTTYYVELGDNTADYAEYCAAVNNLADETNSLDDILFPSTKYHKDDYPSLYCVGTGGSGAGPFRVFFLK